MLDNNYQRLKREGIWVFRSVEEMKDTLIQVRSLASFKFAVLDLSSADEQTFCMLSELKPLLPFRVIIKASEEKKNWVRGIIPGAHFVEDIKPLLGNFDDSQEIMANLWREWLRSWVGDQKPVVHLFLGQKKNSKPTKDWIAWKCNTGTKNLKVYSLNGDLQPYVNDYHVFYDRHMMIERCLGSFNKKLIGTKIAYFFLDKLSSDFISIFTAKPSEQIVYSLLEAGLLRILVIDERIAERVYDSVLALEDEGYMWQFLQGSIFQTESPTRFHVAGVGNIFISTHFSMGGVGVEEEKLHQTIRDTPPYLKVRMHLESSSVVNIEVKLKSDENAEKHSSKIYIQDKRRKKEGKLDFDIVIIHQGVIDTRKPRENFDYKRFVKSLEQLIPFVIVDSGRGIPREVQKTPDVKFLPYSLLNAYLAGRRIAKWRLTDIVMALTRRKEGKR